MSEDSGGPCLSSFHLGTLLRMAEENVRVVAERLEERGVLSDDPVSRAQLADVRLWLFYAARRCPD